jgi:hypothetical protein
MHSPLLLVGKGAGDEVALNQPHPGLRPPLSHRRGDTIGYGLKIIAKVPSVLTHVHWVASAFI